MFDGDLKVLIADDEAPARMRLAGMVQEIGGWKVIAEAANGAQALELCRLHKPDVALLDIRMPGMDGIEVAAMLCALQPAPAVVFTTAYDEYAVSAFETHAVGYLLKPVRRERLLRALEHAAHVNRLQLAALSATIPGQSPRERIPVTKAGRMELIPVEEIVSFHADQKYVRVVHANGAELIDESLKALEDEFCDDFVRLHRNSLVRKNSIEAIERDGSGQYLARVRGLDEPCQVSRRHVSEVKQRLC